MANGKVVYPSGVEDQTTYTFAKNFDYGHEAGYLDTDDRKRTLDGTLQGYGGPLKKRFFLRFSFASQNQYAQFESFWTNKCAMDLYLDGINLDASVLMTAPPSRSSAPAFIDNDFTVSFDVQLEEV